MQNELIDILRSSGADAWAVTDEKKLGWQFYFIRHRLDQNRIVDTEHVTVTVYRKTEGNRYLGSASEEIAPTATTAEIKKAVSDLLERAKYVTNPVYELRRPAREQGLADTEDTVDAALESDSGRSPDVEEHSAVDQAVINASGADQREGSPESNNHVQDAPGPDWAARTNAAAAVSRDFIETMAQLPETATEDVNSYEIFVNEIWRRLVTSTGIDETHQYPSSMLEVVTNARNKAYIRQQQSGHKGPNENGAEEIELYRMYLSGTCDKEGLTRDISRVLQYGKDRLRTVPTPKLDRLPVIFSTADAVQIYHYFVEKMNAQQVFQKVSTWEIGKPIAENVKGDKVTVATRKFLPNSSQNFDFDDEGAPIRDEILIEENVPRNYWGDAMFSSYLKQQGLKEPGDTFIVSNYAVSGGRQTAEEIRQGLYLEVVEFSDFQVNAMTGDIFGEIRLGYLHKEDGSITPVSGGSVSGSMLDYVKEMYLSREMVQYDNARVPAVTKLMNVTVTGAQA